MKILKVKKKDIQFQAKNRAQATAVFQHLQDEYERFSRHLRSMSELVHLLMGVDKDARQELVKKMVGMSDSMRKVWNGIVLEFNKL